MTDSMEPQPDQIADDASVLHQLKNHIAVVIGFCDLLLRDLSEDDPNRADILKMRETGHDAMALLPELSDRMR